MNFKDALSVFDHLLAHSPDDLTAGLERIPDLSSELKNEVTALITAHKQNAEQTQFSSIIAEQVNTLDSDKSLLSLAGEQIQHFKLTTLLGSGGMGVVYLAERCDGQLEQQVAIKIIAPSVTLLTSKELAFKEAQYLARLNHPNIAKIYDVGTTESGLIYLIMEYIEGEPLQAYCKNRPNKELLPLFIKVCDAVSYSHQNRIIHGDLKPDNILVDKLGEPKLVDFGVAHTLSEQSDATYSAYINGLSKDYASPEQLAGEPLTTQSDVYSLGMVLNTLSGQPNRELQQVIAKSLMDIKSRYLSVYHLKSDIVCLLENKPTSANSSQLHRTAKFFKRNPISSLLSAGFIVAIAAFSYSLWQKNNDLQIEKATSDNIANFMVDVFDISNPYNSENFNIPIKDVLQTAKFKLSEVPTDHKGIKAALSLSLAKAYIGAGLFKPARDILERLSQSDDSPQEVGFWLSKLDVKTGNYQDAITWLEDYIELNHSDSLLFESRKLLAEAYREAGEYEQSTAILLTTLKKTLTAKQRITIFLELATTTYATSDYAAMLDYAEKAKSLYQSKGLDSQVLLSDILAKYAGALEEFDKLAEAEKAYNQKLKIDLAVFGENHPYTSQTYNLLSYFHDTKGEFDRALEFANKAIALHSQHTPNGSNLYVATLFNKVSSLAQLRRDKEAIETLLFTEKLCHGFLPENHFWFVTIYNGLGQLYRKQSALDKSEMYLNKALNVLLESNESHNQMLSYLYGNIADLALDKKEYDKARTLYQQSLDINKQEFGAKGKRVAQNMKDLGKVMRLQNLPTEAIAMLQLALTTAMEAYRPEHARLADFHTQLAMVYKDIEQLGKALEHQVKAVKIAETGYGINNYTTQSMKRLLADIYFSKGDVTKAQPIAQAAYDYQLSQKGKDHPETIRVKTLLDKIVTAKM